jgi:hypothetical protein
MHRVIVAGHEGGDEGLLPAVAEQGHAFCELLQVWSDSWTVCALFDF